MSTTPGYAVESETAEKLDPVTPEGQERRGLSLAPRIVTTAGGTRVEGRHRAGAGVLEELRGLWVMSDGDTIDEALARARHLVRAAPAWERDRAAQYLDALQRLERWLRDR